MAKLLAEIGPAPDFADDDHFCYWTFRDMQARRIVAIAHRPSSQATLFWLSSSGRADRRRGRCGALPGGEVKAWLVQREALATQNSAPALKENSGPRGRPRKNQILADSPPG